MPKYYFDRLEYLDVLIRKRSTGSPEQLAKKLNISKRTVFEYIDILRSLGANINYSRVKESYYYLVDGNFSFQFNVSDSSHTVKAAV